MSLSAFKTRLQILLALAAALAFAACAENDGGHEHAASASELADITAIEIAVSGADYETLKAFYRSAAQGGETADRWRVIILPGTPSDADFWGGAMLSIDPRAEVYAIERPGFKGSGPERAVVDLHEQAQAVSSLIEGYDGRILLVGHSFGASVALAAVDLYGDQIDALALVSPYVIPVRGREYQWFKIAGSSLLRFIGGTATHRFFREVSAQREQSAGLLKTAATSCVPVIFIHGALDDTVPLKDVETLAKITPPCAEAELHVIDRGDHFLSVHSARALTGLLNAFIDKVSGNIRRAI